MMGDTARTTGTPRKLAVGLALALALGLGMGAVGLASSGTAAADGLTVSPPAIIDEDGTQGEIEPAGQGTDSAGAPIIDEDGFQAADVRSSVMATPQKTGG